MSTTLRAYERVTKMLVPITMAQIGALPRELHDGYDVWFDDHELVFLENECVTFEPRGDGLAPGFYKHEGKRLTVHSSSTGYDHWRSWLGALAGVPPWQSGPMPKHQGPFVELVYFSDCEGFIGPRTSAKLARDFFEWKDRALDATKRDPIWAEHWAQFYCSVFDAFTLAAEHGVVEFS